MQNGGFYGKRDKNDPFRNQQTEGMGTYQYYQKHNRGAGIRNVLLLMALAIAAILVIVFIVALAHGHSYGQQWTDIWTWFKGTFHPGHIKDGDIKA